jgi:hypothetical protein
VDSRPPFGGRSRLSHGPGRGSWPQASKLRRGPSTPTDVGAAFHSPRPLTSEQPRAGNPRPSSGRPHRPPFRRPAPGDRFQSYILSKFHVTTSCAVCDRSSLWAPTKLWAVALAKKPFLSAASAASILSYAFGDSPDKFSVCMFGPSIFTFTVVHSERLSAPAKGSMAGWRLKTTKNLNSN